MAHTIQEKRKLLHRVRRIRGQIEALEQALAQEKDCDVVFHLIAACRGAIGGLMSEVLEGHIRFHVIDPKRRPSRTQARAAEQLVDVLRTYLK